jgi:L-ascorbate metabolism protein UlaG (beta-lactamase superfamily)
MQGNRLSLRWLGTAGFHLRTGGGELLLDPYLSRIPGARPVIDFYPDEFRDVSLILVSHGHFDHAMDLAQLAGDLPEARIHAPLRTCRNLMRQGIPSSRIEPHERLASFSWHGVQIRAVPSRHIVFDPLLVWRTLRLLARGNTWPRLFRLALQYPVGSNWEILLTLQGYRVLFSGSGGGDWARLARLRPHCCLLPFAGRSDLVDYYLRALRRVRPETVVLHHFDPFFPFLCVDYPVEAFRERLSRQMPEIRLIVPEPKKAFLLP